MTAATWISLSQVIIAAMAAIIAVATIVQRKNADARSEWWKRYSWAAELTRGGSHDEVVRFGWYHLDILAASKLITDTEASIVQDLAVSAEKEDNETSADEEAGDNDCAD